MIVKYIEDFILKLYSLRGYGRYFYHDMNDDDEELLERFLTRFNF
jgi:hypothetical protein